MVEVFTSKNPDSGPSKDWLNFVKSPRARSKIRQWFTKERRDEAIEHGRDAIARAMRKQNLPLQKLMSQESFAEVAAQLRYDDVSALYAAVGEGHVSTQSVIEKVVALVRDVDDIDEPDLPIPVHTRPLPRHSDSACSFAASTSSSSWRGAARPCPATRSWASSRAVLVSRCTSPRATTCNRCCASPSA